jgi:hypothetical protein
MVKAVLQIRITLMPIRILPASLLRIRTDLQVTLMRIRM